MSQAESMDASKELNQIEDRLRQIEEILETQQTSEGTQKLAFERLYEELEQYKRDFIFQTEKPLLLDLLLFFDSLSWFKKSLLDSETNREVLSDSFQFLIDEFMELLYRRDVLPLETSQTFDPQTQRAIQVVPTDQPEHDQRVAKVLKRGFSRAGRPLRVEEVSVKRYQEKPGTSSEEAP